MQLRRISNLLAPAAGLAVVYFFVAKFCLKLAFVNAAASPVWPPSGIAIAALLVFGYRAWPGVFIGALAVNSLTNGNFLTAACIASGNTLEAVAAIWIIRRVTNPGSLFERAQDVFIFSVAAVVSTLISPTVGVSALTFAGFADKAHYATIWFTWWLGDMTGVFIVAPALALWLTRPRRRLDPARDFEVGILLVMMILLSEVVFGGWINISLRNYPTAFLLGPVLAWASFRLSPRETATGIFLLSAISIWGTLHGYGPFARRDPNESLLFLDSFNILTTITTLALAAAMSERRRVEAAIEQQKVAVEAANRTKDNFLAMLSHELRTPLTPVLAMLDSLETGPGQNDETRSALAMIRRNVELESQLIDDLLDLTRIARDKLQLNFVSMDAHRAIQNVAEICKAEAQIRKIRVHLNLRAGAHFIRADEAKFQQIIWNLLKNAIKFTNEGGEISLVSTNTGPGVMQLSVRDTGIGMEREIIDRIFEPFEQGDQTLQRRFGGLGLGLAISKSLAQAHGGTLVAQSEGPGYGSVFTLTLNTISPPTGEALAPQAAPAASRSLRILLVDDHQDTCTALERLLVRRGHLVAATHNMRSAMEAAGRNQFDLLISDIALPDGTGIELMQCLRAISGLRGIAISGFGMNADIEKSLTAGFSEHLVKPVKLDKLEAAIERVMSNGS